VRLVGLTALLLLAASAAHRGDAAAQAGAAPAPAEYTSAKKCAECHKTIHLYWSESAHARSASRPSFLAALDTAMLSAPDKDAVRRACAFCHAPTATLTGDVSLQQPVTREGVTCDFCHTVVDVQMDAPGNRFESRPGKVKWGPLLYAKSPFHDSEYSALHKASPLLCAACHEHRNAQGVAVLSTYSEWQRSPYPERGVTCQECHMPVVPGRSVREGLTASDRVINLHRMSGGSLPAKVQHGVDLKIESVDRGAASAEVQVVVTNSGVGHAVPGGLPANALMLAVGVQSGASRELLHRAERIYRLRLQDVQGRALVRPVELFLDAAAVAEDTRLKPKESRSERFTVPVPADATAIVARLEYRDESDPQAGPKTTLVTEERRPLTGR
jgi:hypothetical protein